MCLPLKVEFGGITGHVAFDDNGHRKDFNLGIYDLQMFRGVAKVRLVCILFCSVTFEEEICSCIEIFMSISNLFTKDSTTVNNGIR